MLGIKPKALHMLGKSFMIELYPCTIKKNKQPILIDL